MKLETEEPSHCCSAPLGQVFEHPVTGYATIVAHRQLAAIGEINASFFTFQAVQENGKWHQQLLHQRHKARIAGRLAKQPCVLVFDAMFIVMLEILVGRIMKHRHDQKHLRQREHVIALPRTINTDPPGPLPCFISLAKIIKTTKTNCCIYLHGGFLRGLLSQHPMNHVKTDSGIPQPYP